MNYEADAEWSHDTMSFMSIHRLITDSDLKNSKEGVLFFDNRLFDDSKSLAI